MFTLPDNFLSEECRDDFVISSMMKRAWATQLHVLYEFDRICQKYDIPYFALDGTLLGAIRHHGYIPWDDDIDIGMFRKDYLYFLKVAKQELPKEFHIANSHLSSEHESNKPVQILNRSSISILQNDPLTSKYYGFPYAAGLDLFILDYIPRNPEDKQTLFALYGLVFHTALEWNNSLNKQEQKQQLSLIKDFTGYVFNPESDDILEKLWFLSESIASIYTEGEADTVAYLPYFVTKPSDYTFPIAYFETTIRMSFEHITIPVPCGYDSYLTRVYGDYMTPQRIPSMHDYPFYKQQEEQRLEYLKSSTTIH